MVVLINYLHVMTILPSSILVNEIYIAPLQKRLFMWCKPNNLDDEKKSEKSVDKYIHSEDADAEKGLPNHTREGDMKVKTVLEKTSEMNRIDRYLVESYAPFITRRSSFLLCSSIILVRIITRRFIDRFSFEYCIFWFSNLIRTFNVSYRQLSLVFAAQWSSPWMMAPLSYSQASTT